MERLCHICFWFRYGLISAMVPANIKMNLSLQKYWTKGVNFVIPSLKILYVVCDRLAPIHVTIVVFSALISLHLFNLKLPRDRNNQKNKMNFGICA